MIQIQANDERHLTAILRGAKALGDQVSVNIAISGTWEDLKGGSIFYGYPKGAKFNRGKIRASVDGANDETIRSTGQSTIWVAIKEAAK